MKKRALQALVILAFVLATLTITSSIDHAQVGSGTTRQAKLPTDFRFYGPT